MDEDKRAPERLLDILWPRDWAEAFVFGFITVTTAAFVGGILHALLFGQ